MSIREEIKERHRLYDVGVCQRDCLHPSWRHDNACQYCLADQAISIIIAKIEKSGLSEEQIGDSLDLEVEGEYRCSGGGIVMTVSVDKLLKAQLKASLSKLGGE